MVLLAKQLASIDQVSRGRLIVGVAAGYLMDEFAAVGVDISERGQRVEEHLAAMRALRWMDKPEHWGRHVKFAGVNAYPRPFHPGGPPIVMGGESRPALRRADTDSTSPSTRPGLAINELAAEQSRNARPSDLGRLEITVTPAGPFDRWAAEQFERLGVDRLVLLLGSTHPRPPRHDPVVRDILRTIDTIASFMR